MKKEYEAPKAEKMVFDYSEVVATSGTPSNCIWQQPDQENYEGCKDNLTKPGDWNDAKPY